VSVIREFLPQDEADLQRLSRQPMPGWIRLAYCNSPSYMAGESVKGDEVSVNVFLDANRRLGGCWTRAVKHVWLEGRCQRIGYLVGLRSFDFARCGRGLFLGYEWLRQREQTDPLPLYITTIVRANHSARALLTSRRANLPAYLEAGEVVAFGVTSRAIQRRCHVAKGYNIIGGDVVGEMRLRAFYDEVSPRRTLFPQLPNPLPTGVEWKDFVVLEKDGEIAAAAAVWNQQSVRQIHVASYHPIMAMFRPVINPMLKTVGAFPLPPPQHNVDCVYLSYRLIRNESPTAFHSLLAAAESRIHQRILFFALHENDALLPGTLSLTAWRYRSTLYTVSFSPNPVPFIFSHPPYIELATL